jgi:hypothetical protein
MHPTSPNAVLDRALGLFAAVMVRQWPMNGCQCMLIRITQIGIALSLSCSATHVPLYGTSGVESVVSIELDEGMCVRSAVHGQMRTGLTQICGPTTATVPHGTSDLLVQWFPRAYKGDALPLFSLELVALPSATYRLSPTGWKRAGDS